MLAEGSTDSDRRVQAECRLRIALARLRPLRAAPVRCRRARPRSRAESAALRTDAGQIEQLPHRPRPLRQCVVYGGRGSQPGLRLGGGGNARGRRRACARVCLRHREERRNGRRRATDRGRSRSRRGPRQRRRHRRHGGARADRGDRRRPLEPGAGREPQRRLLLVPRAPARHGGAGAQAPW